MTEPIDYGAPDVNVTDVAYAEWISENVVRVTLTQPHRDADGHKEARVAVHLQIDRARVPKFLDTLRRAITDPRDGRS